jgi:hypothetical protein
LIGNSPEANEMKSKYLKMLISANTDKKHKKFLSQSDIKLLQKPSRRFQIIN